MESDPLDYLGRIEESVEAAPCAGSPNAAANALSVAMGDAYLAAFACAIAVRTETAPTDEANHLLYAATQDARRISSQDASPHEPPVRALISQVRAQAGDRQVQELQLIELAARLALWTAAIEETDQIVH